MTGGTPSTPHDMAPTRPDASFAAKAPSATGKDAPDGGLDRAAARARGEESAFPRPLPIARRWLSEGRRALAAWCVALAAVAFLYLPIYSSLQTPQLRRMLDSLPPELSRTLGFDQIASGPGYAQATFFGLVGFALVTIAGTSWGAAFVGGAEESGRLELVLAHGVGRIRYAVESSLALLAKLAVWSVDGPAGLGLGATNLLAVAAAWTGLGFLCSTAALAVGAAGGRRSRGLGVGAGMAIVGYAMQAAANNSPKLGWLGDISPYGWAFGRAPLANGFDWAGLALLWGFSAAFVALATIALARRDVTG